MSRSSGESRGRRGLLGGIFALTAGTGAERVLGYARDAGLAAIFGLGATLDAVNVALSIPLLLVSLFPGRGGVRIAGLLIPLYTELREKVSAEEARRLAISVLNLLIVGLLLTAGVLALFPGQMIRFFAPGFTGETAGMAARALQLLVADLVFLGLAGFARAFLMAHEKFALATIANVAANAFLVLYVFTVGSRYGIQGLALAFVVSGLVRLLIPVPQMLGLGLKPSTEIAWGHPGLRRFGQLLLPVTLGMGIIQLSGMVERMMASTLDAGSISALTYANRIRALPLEIFIVGINQATLPRMSLEYTRGGVNGLREMAHFTLRLTTATALPATAFLLVLREPVAMLSFGHGAVGAEGARLIAGSLACYAIGLPALALAAPFAAAFFCMQDSKTPTWNAIAGLGVNIGLNFLLIRPLGIYGLALAASLSSIVHAGLTLAVLSRRIGGIGGREIARTVLLTSVAATAMGAACWGCWKLAGRLFDTTHLGGLFGGLLLAMGVGSCVYILTATWVGVRGTRLAWQFARERLKGLGAGRAGRS